MFDGTLLIRQRVITTYRAELFGLLAKQCRNLVVVSGKPSDKEGIAIANSIEPGKIISVENKEIGKGSFLVYWQDGLMAHVNSIKPDVVVTEANPRFTDTSKLRKWCSSNDSSLIGWGLGTTNFFNRKFAALRRWRQRQTYAKFDSIISYSELAKKQYIESGFKSDNIFVAHNATVKRREMPQRAFSENGSFKIVNIGRLVAHKNIELLVTAVSKLQEEGLDVTLEIIGDGPHRESLESLVSELKVDCTFHGFKRGEELNAIASECSLFVLPGLGGLAIQEAMSMGLPVIVSEADGTEIDLVRKTNGWRIPPDNLESLVNAIREAYSDRKGTFDRGLESFRIFNEEINLETMAEKFMNAITSTYERNGK